MAEPRESSGPDTDAPERARRPTWSVFGDPLGVAVFLVALAVAGGTWQVGFFITDTYAVANGLANLADGHLTVERVYYSLTLGSQPGLHVVDGQLYARNYGQMVAALPAYYAFEVLVAVTQLELLLVGSWSLLVLAACRQVGVVLRRRRSFELGGSVLAAVVFGTSLPLVRPVEAEMTGIAALQALSVVSVAVVALALYRLCARVEGRRLGAVAGLGSVVATPLWFWAAVPKRHTVLAAAVATLLFWFAASRRPGPRVGVPLSDRVDRAVVPAVVEKALVLRVLAYALAALVAWVHAFEGVVVLGSLVVADLATASTTSRRALFALVLGVSVGLAPVLVTNDAVSGNPVEPPRLTDSFQPGGSVEIGPGGTVQSTGGTDTGGSAGGASPDGDGETGTGTDDGGGLAAGALTERIRSSSVVGYVERIVRETGTGPQRLYHTYVRSGRVDSIANYDVNDQETVDLSLAESFPVVGGAVGGWLGALLVRGRQFGDDGTRRRSDGGAKSTVRQLARRGRTAKPARQTEGFAVLLCAGYATLYFPLLPLISQLTVRYLLPAVPALAYLVAQRPVVRRTVRTTGRSLAGGYVVAAVVGLALTVVAFPALDLAVGEAMQLHGLADLAVCGALVAVTVAARAGLIRDTRYVAVALGVAGAATTLLMVRMQLVYFEYGTYAVPVVRQAAAILAG